MSIPLEQLGPKLGRVMTLAAERLQAEMNRRFALEVWLEVVERAPRDRGQLAASILLSVGTRRFAGLADRESYPEPQPPDLQAPAPSAPLWITNDARREGARIPYSPFVEHRERFFAEGLEAAQARSDRILAEAVRAVAGELREALR